MAEWKALEKLLFADKVGVDFVTLNVDGVLAGRPVYEHWQQRFAPAFLCKLAGLELFTDLAFLAANLLLFGLLRRRGASHAVALSAVACFALSRLLLLYRLEYPWDGIDSLIFLTFGWWAAQGGRLLALWPLLLLGTFNHETILFIPLYYLLTRDRKQLFTAGAVALLMGGAIVVTRRLFYKGQPELTDQVFEATTPFMTNPTHFIHDLKQIFAINWVWGRSYISIFILGSFALLAWLAAKVPAHRRAALWSLVVMAAIVVIGFSNETRIYIPLVSFWAAYGAMQFLGEASRAPAA
jgi:hypothetical protein